MDLNGDGKFDGRDFLLHEEFLGDNNRSGGDSGGGDAGCLAWIVLILFVLSIIDIVSRIFS